MNKLSALSPLVIARAYDVFRVVLYSSLCNFSFLYSRSATYVIHPAERFRVNAQRQTIILRSRTRIRRAPCRILATRAAESALIHSSSSELCAAREFRRHPALTSAASAANNRAPGGVVSSSFACEANDSGGIRASPCVSISAPQMRTNVPNRAVTRLPR